MQTQLPLEGIRVIDVSNYLAGSTTSMLLADFGAEVIKVEQPSGGDEFRRWGYAKDGIGLYFKMVARNKKSVTADLRTPIGVEIVKRLVRDADVLIENYRPGTLERWGLGYDVLHQINRRIVLFRMSGYGQDGPYKSKPGYGTAAEAFCGAAYLIGYADRPPVLPAFGLGDTSAGIAGAFLTMVALRERDARSGEGQVVDVSLYEPLMTMLGPIVLDYDQLGIICERLGSRLPWTAPRNVYRTRDGRFVCTSGGSTAIFERLCNALEIPEVAKDPRFGENRDRIRNVEALDELLQAAIARFDLVELTERADRFQTILVPVHSVVDLLNDPHIRERGSITSVEDEDFGAIKMQNVFGKLSRTPGSVRSSGPACGQHNQEILVERLGFSPEELQNAGIPLATV